MGDNKETYGTDLENEWAKKYDVLVKQKLKGKISRYLQTNNVKKSLIIDRIKEIQDLYIEMFEIQYEISQIEPDTLLDDRSSDVPIFAWVIDAQAKNWLNRLSSTLNVLTIKVSEFNEIDAKRREKSIFIYSIIISTLIGGSITWYFDKNNDNDLNNQTHEISKYQDSITNKMRQEYILYIDTLKTQHQQQSIIDSIFNNKIDTAIKQTYKIIENQNKLKASNDR